MSHYGTSSDLYDALYGTMKDYEAETKRVEAEFERASRPVHRVLDVACGTGRHAAALAAPDRIVDGIDLEPAFVETARRRNPDGTFRVADMRDFTVEESYDAVLCLFGSIGYALDEVGLVDTLGCLAAATRPGGIVVVEPWFAPGVMTDGWVALHTAQDGDRVIVRMSHTKLSPAVSTLHLEYLVGTPSGLEQRSEVHHLGLFRPETMVEAFRNAGLDVTWDSDGLTGRGLYTGIKRD